MSKECNGNCKENCKKELSELTERHSGMQRMVIDMVTAYLFSEEAEESGIDDVHISKIYEDDSIVIRSSFGVKQHTEDIEEMNGDIEVEDEEDEDTNEDDKMEVNIEILKDLTELLGKIYNIEREDENVKPKRGRKKKTDKE